MGQFSCFSSRKESSRTLPPCPSPSPACVRQTQSGTHSPSHSAYILHKVRCGTKVPQTARGACHGLPALGPTGPLPASRVQGVPEAQPRPETLPAQCLRTSQPAIAEAGSRTPGSGVTERLNIYLSSRQDSQHAIISSRQETPDVHLDRNK